jgi:hypothetical protein
MQHYLKVLRVGESMSDAATALSEIGAATRECFDLEGEMWRLRLDTNKYRERQRSAALSSMHQQILADINLGAKLAELLADNGCPNDGATRSCVLHALDALVLHLAREGQLSRHSAHRMVLSAEKHI